MKMPGFERFRVDSRVLVGVGGSELFGVERLFCPDLETDVAVIDSLSQGGTPALARWAMTLRAVRSILLATGVLLGLPVAAAAELEIDHPMHRRPQLGTVIWRKTFSDRLKPLWRQALERPEAELRRIGADTVAIAVQRGMSGLKRWSNHCSRFWNPTRIRWFAGPAAHALIAIDARGSASQLYSAAQNDGLAMALIVEPTLARWKYPAIHELWLGRLQQEDPERNMLLLAVEGLGVVSEHRAVEGLIALLDDRLRSPKSVWPPHAPSVRSRPPGGRRIERNTASRVDRGNRKTADGAAGAAGVRRPLAGRSTCFRRRATRRCSTPCEAWPWMQNQRWLSPPCRSCAASSRRWHCRLPPWPQKVVMPTCGVWPPNCSWKKPTPKRSSNSLRSSTTAIRPCGDWSLPSRRVLWPARTAAGGD